MILLKALPSVLYTSLGRWGWLQTFPFHRPIRQFCCSSSYWHYLEHNCPCQNSVSTPATHFCWFWLLEAHSDNGKGWRRGGEGLWISQVQTLKHPSSAVSTGCCAPVASLGRLKTGHSLGTRCPFPWAHFLGRTQPPLYNLMLVGFFTEKAPSTLAFYTSLHFAVDGIFLYFVLSYFSSTRSYMHSI